LNVFFLEKVYRIVVIINISILINSLNIII